MATPVCRPTPDVERRRAAGSPNGVECAELVEHRQRAVDGVGGVVGVRDGRAEVGHDPVAHELVQRAAVLEDLVHHPPVVLVEHPDHLDGWQGRRRWR